MDWINFTKDITTSVLALAGLCIAKDGLVTWKKQIKGTKEFDAAYDLHYSVLKLRDAMKHVRNPAIWPAESHEALKWAKNKYPNISEEEVEKDRHAYVYQMRWEEIREISTELDSHLLAVEVLWGSEIFNLLLPLSKKVTELAIAIQQYFQSELRTGDYKNLHDTIYNKSNENEKDNFSKDVEEIVQKITDYIKGKIS